jgi:glycosyltransferase involved in cell wall biosynthesis
MVETPTVSFCATNLNTVGRLASSLASIDRIGSSLGAAFEVVVADGPSDDGARKVLEDLARSSDRFRLVAHTERNRGYGRRRAFEASRGATIVPFDTSLVYDPLYGGLLRGYLALHTDRMLFSEICALSRRSIEEVGGWRDLVGGEDIDLYSRIIHRYGVIAYPTATASSQAPQMSSAVRQMRYVQGSRWRKLRRIYAVQRDQMIGANYRVHDLMLFNSAKPAATRFALWGFFSLCAVGARFRTIRPIRAEQNNYLHFRESLLRSMSLGEYRQLDWAGPPAKLLLTSDEIRYLSEASPLWKEFGKEVDRYVGPKP